MRWLYSKEQYNNWWASIGLLWIPEQEITHIDLAAENILFGVLVLDQIIRG